MKRCTNCGKEKDESEFYHNKNRPDGLTVYCKPCQRFMNGQRVYRSDRRIGKHDFYDVQISRPLRTETDASYEKVALAILYWVRTKTLTLAQAEAVLMHDVELLSFKEIGRLTHMHYTSVIYQYKNGIRRLRERYHDTLTIERL